MGRRKKPVQVDITGNIDDLILKQEKEETKRITVILPEALINNIEKMAKRKNRALSTYIREDLIIPKFQEIMNDIANNQ